VPASVNPGVRMRVDFFLQRGHLCFENPGT
jgi:hypothetical protein